VVGVSFGETAAEVIGRRGVDQDAAQTAGARMTAGAGRRVYPECQFSAGLCV